MSEITRLPDGTWQMHKLKPRGATQERKIMDDKIPYIALEAEMARHERTVKRLLVALIAAVTLLFASNVAWLCFFNQFEFQTEAVMFDTDDGGDNSYIGNDGVINNGKDGSTEDNDDSQEATP